VIKDSDDVDIMQDITSVVNSVVSLVDEYDDDNNDNAYDDGDDDDDGNGNSNNDDDDGGGGGGGGGGDAATGAQRRVSFGRLTIFANLDNNDGKRLVN